MDTQDSSKLREVPPLSQILGLVEGQLIMAKEKDSNGYDYSMKKHTIVELYDNYLIISRFPTGESTAAARTIDMRDVEAMIDNKELVPLMRDNKPAMARRVGIFKKKWAIDY